MSKGVNHNGIWVESSPAEKPIWLPVGGVVGTKGRAVQREGKEVSVSQDGHIMWVTMGAHAAMCKQWDGGHRGVMPRNAILRAMSK